MEKFLLVDGNSLLNRAFYALPVLSTASGEYTNAVYGFFNMLFSMLDRLEPGYAAVAFDRKEPTFRHKQFAEYKAGRKPMPDELIPQFPLLKSALEEINMPFIEMPGYEADDLLGTLSLMGENSGLECCVLSGDKDVLQLVSDRTTVFLTKKGISELETYTPAFLMEKMGLEPGQIVDLKALMGDSSDNIPGIPGIGEKTALKLLGEYKNVDNLLAHADEIKGKLGEKIAAGRENALLSRQLATIDRNVPIEGGAQQFKFERADEKTLRALFTRLEFKSLLKKLPAGEEEINKNKQSEIVQLLPEELPPLGEKIAVYWSLDETGGLYITDDGQKEYYIKVCDGMLDEGVSPQSALEALSGLFNGRKLIGFDVKALMHALNDYKCPLPEEYEDAVLAWYLLEPLKNDYPIEALTEKYASGKACAVWAAFEDMLSRLEREGAGALYREIELPLLRVLFDMELIGFRADADVLRELSVEYTGRLNSLSARIFEMAGESFNINSTKQLGSVLFEKLGLPHGRKTKTGYSTDIDVLENLREQHEIIPLIMEYRQIQKIKSTYTDGLLALIQPEGRIHTTFKQTVTATGRISSVEPNLQNIPVRTDEGRNIRRAFIPAEGCVLLDGDYSQIELRVLAHLSGDEHLIKAFNEDEDIHTSTAARVFNVPVGEVDAQMRRAAKAVNFGIIYGISDFGLASNIGVSRRQAGEYIKEYFQSYPKIKEFMDRCVSTAKEKGYAQTIMGRRRPMPELTSSNYNTRTFGERAAMNMPVQGSAADIIKAAMIKTAQALKDKNLKSRLILQVHDELIIEAPEGEAEEAGLLLKECMENVLKLSVPLKVEVKAGKSWYETK